MKKPSRVVRLVVMIVAAFVAGTLVESVVRYAVGYPVFPRQKVYQLAEQVYPNDIHSVKAPYCPYWTVEGNNSVFSYNNIGLPGTDVRFEGDPAFVFVVGTSFVEALQCPADRIGTSVFQQCLDSVGTRYQVLNLGWPASDPYADWFRCRFTEMQYPPLKVLLVIDESCSSYLSKYPRPLSFELGEGFGRPVSRGIWGQCVDFLRANSAFVNLLAMGMGKEAVMRPVKDESSPPDDADAPLDPALTDCLDSFQRYYGTKLICLSIMADTASNARLRSYCDGRSIAFEGTSTMVRSEHRIGGTGHFNLEGNDAFGRFLFTAFDRHK